MDNLDSKDLESFVNENINDFHQKRISILSRMTLNELLEKNPYLYKAKNLNTASSLIESTMAAFLSSSEEKVFGDFLEELAIYVAGKTCSGRKSASQGIDLELEQKSVVYIISIKSGPNWGNSSQHKKLVEDFNDAVRRLRQSKTIKSVQPTLGICYGKTRTVHTKQGYLKVVGQNFWTLISGDRTLYTKIIEPIGFMAKEHNYKYESEKARITNVLTKAFIQGYCKPSGELDWEKIVIANSGNYDLDQFD